jgi:hypothetical protein
MSLSGLYSLSTPFWLAVLLVFLTLFSFSHGRTPSYTERCETQVRRGNKNSIKKKQNVKRKKNLGSSCNRGHIHLFVLIVHEILRSFDSIALLVYVGIEKGFLSHTTEEQFVAKF